MAIQNVLAGVAVMNLDKTVALYAKVLGRDPNQRSMAEAAESAANRAA
jgi:hypothetical protein